MVHEHCKYCVLLATPMDTTHYVLSAHTHNLAQDIGKGHQQAAHIIERSDIDSAVRAGYVLYHRYYRLRNVYVVYNIYGSIEL